MMSRVGRTQSPLHEVAPDDATLVAQAIDGNERAFATLYRRHARYVAGVVYRLMGSDAELEDVVQEAFIDASRALSSLNDPGGFRSWLARIVVRRVHKRLARRRRWRWLLGAVADVVPKVSDPAVRERVDVVYEALDAIAPQLRIPWTLHVIEGQTLPEVAAICEVSLATVKRRIADASAIIERRLHELH
jgi:RNA polymerase sigma-70 factor (ECF subfamily)